MVCARAFSLLYALHRWSNLHVDDDGCLYDVCLLRLLDRFIWSMEQFASFCAVFSLFFFFHHWNSQDLRKLDYMAKNSAFRDQINDEPFVTLFFFLVPSKMQNAFFSFGPAHSICKVSLEFLPTTLKDLWHKISSNGGFNFAKKKEIISSFVQRSFSGNNFWTRTVFFSFLSWNPFFSNKTQNTTTLIKVHGFI